MQEVRGGALRPAPGGEASAAGVNKVAALTASFWILKIVVTTAGDLSGDGLSIALGLGYELALGVSLAAFLMLLAAQLRAKRFIAPLYWIVLLSSSTVGAEISDSIDRAVHWGNLAGTVLFLVCLITILAVWRVGRGSIGSAWIDARQDERFYWLAAIFANGLGSAFGDLVGAKLGLGLLGGIAVNLAVVALVLAIHYTIGAGKGVLFWTAFVVTRVPF